MRKIRFYVIAFGIRVSVVLDDFVLKLIQDVALENDGELP